MIRANEAMAGEMKQDFGWLSRHGVLCFGGEDWWYHNRGHADMQYMRQLAPRAPVLYTNSVVMRKPNVSEGSMFVRRLMRKARSISRGLVQASEGFWVYSPLSLPLHHVATLRQANTGILRTQVSWAARHIGLRRPLIWVNCPAACDASLALGRVGLVYQRTDRYEEYPPVDPRQIRAYDQRLKQAADLTFFSSRRLYEEEASECRKAAYIEHGVDVDRFAHARNNPWVPPEIQDLEHPIAGFYGGIDAHTFDMRLMVDVVKRLPDVTFVFVGNASVDCRGLTRHQNVVHIGQRPYEQIPHYAKCFDVCLMPWNQNRWIEACNPVKLKEYLALGKPVVSTPFPELASMGRAIWTATDAPAFAAGVHSAIALNKGVQAIGEEAVPYVSWGEQLERIIALTFNSLSER